MKKKLLGMVVCYAMMALVACENQIINDNTIRNEEKLQEVTFSVLDFEQTLTQMGVMSADTRASLTGNATYLKVALFLDDTKKYEFAQTSEDDNFGTISALIVPENYTMVVIASKVEMIIDAPTDIHSAGDKLNDTFYYYGALTKANIQEKEVAVGLDRAVARFEFQTDEKPSEVATFSLSLTGGSTTFNAVTGLGVGNSTLTNTFDQTGRTSVHCGLYVFLPSADTTVTVTATAYDAAGAIVKTYTFNNVQMKPAYNTYCSGNFFQIDTSWSVTINDTSWPASISYPYDLSNL